MGGSQSKSKSGCGSTNKVVVERKNVRREQRDLRRVHMKEYKKSRGCGSSSKPKPVTYQSPPAMYVQGGDAQPVYYQSAPNQQYFNPTQPASPLANPQWQSVPSGKAYASSKSRGCGSSANNDVAPPPPVYTATHAPYNPEIYNSPPAYNAPSEMAPSAPPAIY
eukprot:Nk52_evm94s224 gene=Nk52_evmTU94s224